MSYTEEEIEHWASILALMEGLDIETARKKAREQIHQMDLNLSNKKVIFKQNKKEVEKEMSNDMLKDMDMLKAVLGFAPTIEGLTDSAIAILAKFANEYWDPKWSEKQAKYYAKYYNTLIKQGLPASVATVMTIGLSNVPKETAKQLLETMPKISELAEKTKRESKREEKEI